jgi:ribonuclease D
MTVENGLITNISKEELKKFPLDKFRGEILIIDDEAQVIPAIDELSKSDFLGFDTESKPSFEKGKSNLNPVALIQFSTADKAFLFRINKIGVPEALRTLMLDEQTIKIGSGVKGDIEKLAKLNHSNGAGGFVDVQTVAKNHGIVTYGLKKLSAIFLGFRISKRHQLTNWESETLTTGQQNYAATDAWVCYRLYEEFKKRNMI